MQVQPPCAAFHHESYTTIQPQTPTHLTPSSHTQPHYHTQPHLLHTDGSLRVGEPSSLLWVLGMLQATDHPLVPVLWEEVIDAFVDVQGGALKGDLQEPSTRLAAAQLSRLALVCLCVCGGGRGAEYVVGV